ncbi:MAG: hypothetical protein LBC03_05505, partial [Nitrososphaerota archaeon]|nr:hypothetical protein [Nitrososphaerota archaeon]
MELCLFRQLVGFKTFPMRETRRETPFLIISIHFISYQKLRRETRETKRETHNTRRETHNTRRETHNTRRETHNTRRETHN